MVEKKPRLVCLFTTLRRLVPGYVLTSLCLDMVLRCRAYVVGPGLIFRAKEEIFPVHGLQKK